MILLAGSLFLGSRCLGGPIAVLDRIRFGHEAAALGVAEICSVLVVHTGARIGPHQTFGFGFRDLLRRWRRGCRWLVFPGFARRLGGSLYGSRSHRNNQAKHHYGGGNQPGANCASSHGCREYHR